MDQESRNWFRFSKLIMDVGTDVLRNLVAGNAQTLFLYDLVNVLIEKVEETKYIKKVQYLRNCLTQRLKQKDTKLKKTLEPIINSFKNPRGQLTFSDQVSILEKWQNDIEKIKNSSQSHVTDVLSSWIGDIQKMIEHLRSMSTCLQTLTTGFLEICETSRRDLIRNIENHYDEFLSSSRIQISTWQFLSNHELKEVITNLEREREKKLNDWKEVLEMYFRSLRQNINDFLTSWKENITGNTNSPELMAVLDVVETEINGLNATKIQTSCDTWHQDLHNLFNTWLAQMDKPVAVRQFLKQCEKELEEFPSISSQQLKDYFVSEGEMLKEQLTDKYYTKLCPSSASPDLSVCDTSLLFVVLKQCLVRPPMYGWNEDPPESDKSLGADILRLKSCRNKIVAHIEAAKIDQSEFNRSWLHVKNVLCRLASSLGGKYETQVSMEVDRIQTCPFNPEIESEWHKILTWCKDDIFAELEREATVHKCVNMLQLIEKIERQKAVRSKSDAEKRKYDEAQTLIEKLRSQLKEAEDTNQWLRSQLEEERRRREAKEGNTDSVLSMPQGINDGWKEGYKVGGPVVGALGAVGGGALGLYAGMRHAILRR